YGDFFHDMV
nr:Chain C, TYR-GLY-ASP-PHE-PHE-HIS-ASP-MET-VAL [uncultured virus]